MLALSIRQPHAELILRGIKTVEYRSRPTRQIGRRFWIYAAGTWPPTPAARRDIDRAVRTWSRDLAMPWDGPDRNARPVGPVSQAHGNRSDGPRGRGPSHRRRAGFDHDPYTRTAAAGPPEWMMQLMAQLLGRDDLPTGVIVGSAVIQKITPPDEADGLWRWHLGEVRRSRRPRRPENHPQPSWFEPFGKAA